MKEDICIQLTRVNGEPRDQEHPDEPPVRAKAECLANTEDDCPKTRAKFRITEVCFRIRHQKKVKENEA
ncbi:MAG: hypothetical protein M0Q91_13880 [Methanoregula sp.]|nr:hypothetical protein [Methanoregula sp.]